MDYFNEGEGEKQAEFAAKRDRIFAPITRRLAAKGITPTQVSIAGVVMITLAAALPASFWGLALVLSCLYVLADGLDGPLARNTGVSSPGGSLVDIFADQVGLIIVATGAIIWIDAQPALQVGFAFTYIMTIFLMVICNQLKVVLPLIIRVKYFYFALYIASLAIGGSVYLDIFAAAGFAYYLWFFFVLFKKMYGAVNQLPQ